MPELRYYTVTQTREVKVSATGPTNAALLAARIFTGTKQPEDQINIQQNPREIELDIREDR